MPRWSMEKYSRLDSPVHRMPAGLKLSVAVGIVLGIAACHALWVYLVVAVLLVSGGIASTVPPRALLSRLLLLEPFVLGVAVLTVLTPNGIALAATIALRGTLCLAAMVLLTHTTPFADLLEVLRRLSVPALLITVLALMVRYLYVLGDEAERMQRARVSRTFTRQRRWAWRSTADLIGQLFVRSSERAERIYAAMCARGWK